MICSDWTVIAESQNFGSLLEADVAGINGAFLLESDAETTIVSAPSRSPGSLVVGVKSRRGTASGNFAAS